MKPWFEELFENYGRGYESESFTRGTLAEVDFIAGEIGPATGPPALLDLGCGTGRHAVELARRGYRVTGIDLSESMPDRARAKAADAGLTVEFLRRDARDFAFPAPFDAVIMICEGAFPLMPTDAENFAILRNAAAALAPGGTFILTTLSVLYPLFHSVKDFINDNQTSGDSSDHQFDLLTFRDRSRYEFTDDDGRRRELDCNERYYAPSEITWLLKSLGFAAVDIFGCDTGRFSRDIPLTPDHYEMLVVAKKEN